MPTIKPEMPKIPFIKPKNTKIIPISEPITISDAIQFQVIDIPVIETTKKERKQILNYTALCGVLIMLAVLSDARARS